MVIYGGSKPTGIDAVAWAKEAEERGAGEILLTSMETDGTKNGFDIAITSAISDAAGIPVIASGGVGTLEHFYDGFTKGKADACLAASVFHYGEFTVKEVKEYLRGGVSRYGSEIELERGNGVLELECGQHGGMDLAKDSRLFFRPR